MLALWSFLQLVPIFAAVPELLARSAVQSVEPRPEPVRPVPVAVAEPVRLELVPVRIAQEPVPVPLLLVQGLARVRLVRFHRLPEPAWRSLLSPLTRFWTLDYRYV
jgi:hypothetical protein